MQISSSQTPRFGAVIGTTMALPPKLNTRFRLLGSPVATEGTVQSILVRPDVTPREIRELVGDLQELGYPTVYLPHNRQPGDAFGAVKALDSVMITPR